MSDENKNRGNSGKLDWQRLDEMLPDNRYKGTPEYWALHEEIVRKAAWQGRMIEADELEKLPFHAQTGFVARCAIRARYLLRYYWQGSIEEERCLDELVNFVGRFSCGESGLTMNEAFSEVDGKYRACGKISERIEYSEMIPHECLEAIYDAGRVAARVAGHLASLSNQYPPWSAAHSCHNHLAIAAFAHAGDQRSQVHRSMEADFEVLKFRSEREKWTRDLSIDCEFFAWHSEFDILIRFDVPKSPGVPNIRELTQGWNAAFNNKYVHYPREIFEMSDDERCSFFVNILARFGFCVNLILPSENGRTYLIGINHKNKDINELLLLSRHSPGGNEALVAVNRLHGREPGSNGNLLFSTAFLMKRPHEYALRVAPGMLSKFALLKKDIYSLSAWLSKHQESELHRCDPI